MLSTFFSRLIRLILRAITYVNGLWLFFILVFLVILPGLAELLTSIFSPATIDGQAGHQRFPAATCAIIWPYVKLFNLGDINCFSASTNNFELVPFPAGVLLVLLDGLLLFFIEAAKGVETYRESKRAAEASLRYAEQKRVEELYEKERREVSIRQAEIERNKALEKAEAALHERLENLISPAEVADKQVEIQSIRATHPFYEDERSYHRATRKKRPPNGQTTSLRRDAAGSSSQSNENQGEL